MSSPKKSGKTSSPSFVRKHRKKLWVILLASLVGAGILAYVPARNALRASRAAGLLEQARELAEAGEWREARRTAAASLQNEESLEAFRIVTQAAVAEEDRDALGLVYRLFALPGATTEDRLLALKTAYDRNDQYNARILVSQLSPDEKKIPEIHYQVVRGLLMAGLFEKALALVERPPESEGSWPLKLDLLLARWFAKTNLKGAVEATNERLERVLTGADRDLALEALDFLILLPDGRIDQKLAEAALERLQDDPGLEVQDRLNLDFLRVGLKKSPLEETVNKALEDYRESHPAELIPWLDRLGQFEAVLELTSEWAEPMDQSLFDKRLQALARLGRFEELEEELKEPPVVIPEPALLIFRSVIAAAKDDRLRAYQYWDQAFEAARRDRSENWFYKLMATAGNLGDNDRQMKSLAEAIKHPLGTPPQAGKLAPLFAWLDARGDTKSLFEVSSHLLRWQPNDPVLINNYLYAKSLHDKVTEEEVAALRALITKYPVRNCPPWIMPFMPRPSMTSAADPRPWSGWRK